MDSRAPASLKRKGRSDLVSVVLFVALIAAACASSPEEARRAAPILVSATWTEDALHCRESDCENLYQLIMKKSGRIKLTANAPADPTLPDFVLELRDRDGHVIAEDRELMKRPRQITRGLAPGLYYVAIIGRDKRDDRLSYKLRYDPIQKQTKRAPSRQRPTATKASPPPPPPLPPEPKEWIRSEVLEVERDGSEPVAVLLEAGTSQGLKPGLRGELVEADQVIGKLEVVDVYAEGSRARIIGALTAPITLDTTARLEK